MEAGNERGVDLARSALEAYRDRRGALHRSDEASTGLGWSESEVIDLITDLLLLARKNGFELSAMLAKVEAHIEAETGRAC